MNDNVKWFKEAKYGMFIHWGLYSLLAGEHNGEDAGVKKLGTVSGEITVDGITAMVLVQETSIMPVVIVVGVVVVLALGVVAIALSKKKKKVVAAEA